MEDSDFLTQLKSSISGGPEMFRLFLEEKLTDNLSWQQFDQLIEYLEDLPETEPVLSLSLSSILLELFPEDMSADPARRGAVWHVRILSILYQPEPDLLLKSINQALDYCEQDGVNAGTGYMICRNAKEKIVPGVIGEDTMLLLYKRIIEYFKNIGELKEAVEFMLYAATIFCRQGAYQPAERLLQEAKEIAAEKGFEELKVEVGFAIAQAAVDQHDHERAETILESLFKFIQNSGGNVPKEQMFNLAVIKMRLHKTPEAFALFTEIAENASQQTNLKFSAILHSSICQKDLGHFTAAEESFVGLQKEADELDGYNREDFDIEINDLLIEFDLVYALITATNGNQQKALNHLNKAVLHIEDALQFTVRPHYRKYIRSLYQNRLLAVIALVWRSATAKDLLPTFICLKKNTQSDWLSILAWIEFVQVQPQITTAEKDKLNQILEKLHEHSGMILGSYHEKYDDPFEWASRSEVLSSAENDSTSNVPWQDFALFAEKLIHCYKLHPVFHFSNKEQLEGLLTSRLQEKYILLFVFLTKEGYTSYILGDDSVFCESLETFYFESYWKALLDYRDSKIDWTDFARPFHQVVEFIDDQLTVIWNELSITTRRGLYIFNGVMDSFFPLPQACLSNDVILEQLGKDDFIISQCPVMFPQKKVEGDLTHLTVLINRHRELALFEPEARAASLHFTSAEIKSVSCDDDIYSQLGEINTADVIHIITHGRPISIFRDPAYASLAGQSFGIGALKSLHSAKSQLYFISACNAADSANPPAGMIITSNEIIGYNTILMQNRKAKVIGSKWPLLDSIGFLFTCIFYKILAETGNIHTAYGRTIFLMATKKTDFFLPFLEQVNSEDKKNRLKLELSQYEKPFDIPFYYAALNLYTLI